MSKLRKRFMPGRPALALLLFMAALLGGAVQGYASKTDLVTIAAHRQQQDPTIVITQGTAEMVAVGGPVSDIMVADPSIIEVTALQSNQLYIVGRALGSTNLIAVDENGNTVKRLNVHVTIDTDNIQRIIEKLFPDEEVQVEALRGQVILSGSVSTPDVAQSIQNMVTHHITEIEGKTASADEMVVNLMTIKGKAQVMLRVKVMEVSRNVLRERDNNTLIDDLGISFGGDLRNSRDMGGIFGGVINGGTSEPPFAAFGLLESFGGFGPIDTIISLLEEQGLARIMAEPNLTAISGEQAGFLAGGEFPVPSGRDTDGNIIITFRQFGVSLSFAPVVMSENRIVLKFETEVSSLSRDSDVTLQGIQVPGLDVRRASTTVEMGSGASLMIAGLLQSQTIKNLSGIPGMSKAPIIGDLMSSDSFRREETEMVVLVTPYIVQPYGDKKQGTLIPEAENKENELATAFARNVRRTYGKLNISTLFDGDHAYGYIID